jgi:hypothetical protein
MVQTHHSAINILLPYLKTLTLCAVLIGTSALAETDSHAGHHPVTAPATPAPASTVNAPKADPACPMMSGQTKSGGAAPIMPAQASSEKKMQGDNMMMDHMKSDRMDNCMKSESRPSANTATPPASPPK